MKPRTGRSALVAPAVALALVLALPAVAHLNSPHIYVEESVGPYPVLIVVDMPPAVPGEAEIQVMLRDRGDDEPVEVRVREIPPQGEETAAGWRVAEPDPDDPNFRATVVPLTLPGFWQAQVEISGERGSGRTTIPVSARIPQPQEMTWDVTAQLAVLGTFLLISLTLILGAMGRLAHRVPGEPLTDRDRRRGRITGAVGVVVLIVYLAWVGSFWNRYHQIHEIRAIPKVTAELSAINPPVTAGRELLLELTLRTGRGRPVTDLAPDHGKMMNLAIVERPGAAYFAHLHPKLVGPGVLRFSFTPPREGTYRLFGNVLFASGEADTVVAELRVGPGRAPDTYAFDDPDDSHAFGPAFGGLEPGHREADLGDGLTLRWDGPPEVPLKQREPTRLEFSVLGADGRLAPGVEPLIGQPGHLLTMRQDGEVFAHLYPSGTVGGRPASDDPTRGGLPPRLAFPYGFPEPGLYRMWVQVRYGGVVRTGVFDVEVTS